MVDRSEFFKSIEWRSLVKRNFANNFRRFVDIEISGVEFPVVLEDISVPGIGSVCFCRYASVYFSDYFDFENSENVNTNIFQKFRHIVADQGADVIWLSNIPVGENFYKTLNDYSDTLGDNYFFLDCISTVGVRCNESYEAYIQSLSKNTRRNIRRKVEALKNSNGQHNIIPVGLKNINTLMINQAKRAEGSELDIVLENPDLVNTLLNVVGIEGVHISEVHIGDAVASQLLLLISEDTIGVLMQSFDSGFAHLSPSFCNLVYLIEYAHKHSFKYVDLLRGKEEYKLHLVNNEIEMKKFVQVLNPNLDSNILISFLQSFEE